MHARKGRRRVIKRQDEMMERTYFFEKYIFAPPVDLYRLPQGLILARAKAGESAKVRDLQNAKKYAGVRINDAKICVKELGLMVRV